MIKYCVTYNYGKKTRQFKTEEERDAFIEDNYLKNPCAYEQGTLLELLTVHPDTQISMNDFADQQSKWDWMDGIASPHDQMVWD